MGPFSHYRTRAIVVKMLILLYFVIFVKGILRVWGALSTRMRAFVRLSVFCLPAKIPEIELSIAPKIETADTMFNFF